jgi:hypothetical protein
MIRTASAQHLAPVADGARPCSGFGHGYQWRAAGMCINFESMHNTTKRPARHLGIAPT